MQKVLIVDDTKNIRLLLTKCLEVEGYAVKSAKDGREALEILSIEVFDLVFLDIKMPHLSGTELLVKVRSMGILTPVIVITAYATVKNAIECTQMGAVAYLQKPFTAERVRNVLKEIMTLQCTVDIFSEVEKCIEEQNYTQALTILKKRLAQNPLEGKIYNYLSKVSLALGRDEEAKQYTRMYKSFGSLR